MDKLMKRTDEQEIIWQAAREKIIAVMRSHVNATNWAEELSGAILALPEIQVRDENQKAPIRQFVDNETIYGYQDHTGFIKVLPK
jgi:hypothetical protein